MLHPDDEKFYTYWEKERAIPHYKRKSFLRGLSISLLLGILILIVAEMGWYERANMVANSRGNILWILITILLVSVGFGWIYQQFTSEMNEQRFNEIKYIKNKKWPILTQKTLKNQQLLAFLAFFYCFLAFSF